MSHTNMKARCVAVFSAVLLVGAQTFAPLSALIPVASAAPICAVDTAGANDVPGQKDLTKLCVDYAGLPVNVQTTWNWDELGTSGNNTMDACNLFDTNGNGNADYAVCVTTIGNPATFQSLTTYSCGDARNDRCTSPSTLITNGSTACTVSQQNTDPFPTDSAYPADTQGQCAVDLSAVGGATAKLIDVCSYPSSQPNSDPSDCVIARANSAKIEVLKSLVPNTDSGRFDLKIDGTTYASNIGDGGDTGQQVVTADGKTSHTVLEQADSSTNATSLTNYATSVVCKDQHGTGSVVANSSPTGSLTRQLSFTPTDGQDIVCTFTNTRQTGSITLVKNVINNNGGTATANDFGLSIGGTSVTSGQTLTLPTGSYAVNEAGKTGYSFVSITGTGCPAQLGDNVTLTSGQSVTCTITNDDQPAQLKVVKTVINDNGGTAAASDFTMYVNGAAVTQGVYTSENAGSYGITESGPSGYTQTGIACVDDSTQQAVSYPVTLNLGQSVTCTVTNDDVSPTLTVIKHVINDDGGTNVASDFTMNVTGTNVSQPSFPGSETGTTVSLNAGSYSVGETGPSGYAASYSADCSGTIAVGQQKACTITNDDIMPILTLVKTVINDNGGTLQVSDFPLFVDNTQVTSGVANGFNAGSYTASEQNKPGYAAGSWGGDCSANGSITLQIGGVYTCTVTNNDQPGTLIVKKVVVNSYGGTGTADDFSFSVNGGTPVGFNANGENDLTVDAGTYSVTEPNTFGYAASYDNCDRVAIANGQTATCTITNSDVAPSLTVVKEASPLTSQSFSFTSNELGSFSLAGDGSQNGSKTFSGLSAGSYTFNEQATNNWGLDSMWCDNEAYTTNGSSLTVNLSIGNSVTCFVFNTEKNTISGHKFNDVNDNHSWDNGEPALPGWTITLTKGCDVQEESVVNLLTNNQGTTCAGAVNLTTVTDSTGAYSFTNLEPGTYTVCEVQQPKWEQTFPQTSNGCYVLDVEGPGQVLVANFGNHPVPQVLGKELVNTGASAGQNVLVGLSILGTLVALHLATRRRQPATR